MTLPAWWFRLLLMMGRSISPRPGGAASTALCAALVITSAVAQVCGRKLGPGGEWLTFDPLLVMSGQIWRLFTYPFVEGQPLRLMVSALFLYLFLSAHEARVGTRATYRFFFAASIGGAVLALAFHQVLSLLGLFVDHGSEGPDTVISALLVMLALRDPNAEVLFGFILPVSARTVVYFLLGSRVLFALMDGQAALSITLGGMSMGWLLHTGRWHPRTWRGLRPAAKRRRDIYIVRPRDHDLH